MASTELLKEGADAVRLNKRYILPIYAVAILFAFTYRDSIIHWLQAANEMPLLIVFLSAVLLALIPLIPFGVVGAVLGAKYGFLMGALLSLSASSLAACIMYFFFRYLFVDRGLAYLQKSNRLQQWDSIIRKHWFWSVLIARLIPVMPAVFTNSYAGVFNMPFRPFVLATIVGKIPTMLVFAFVGENAVAGSFHWIRVVLLYLIFLGVVYSVYRFIMRKQTGS